MMDMPTIRQRYKMAAIKTASLYVDRFVVRTSSIKIVRQQVEIKSVKIAEYAARIADAMIAEDKEHEEHEKGGDPT